MKKLKKKYQTIQKTKQIKKNILLKLIMVLLMDNAKSALFKK